MRNPGAIDWPQRPSRVSLASTQATRYAAHWRRLHAKRDRRRVGGTGLDAAGDLPLVEECRLTSRRPAISADQHFVAAARGRARSAQAVVADDPQRGTGRSRFTLRSRRTGRPDRTRRTGDAGIALRSWRPGDTGIAFLPLAAARQRQHQQPDKNQSSATHFFNPLLGAAPSAPHMSETSMRSRIPNFADAFQTASCNARVRR